MAPDEAPRLPDFIIGGAMKSGTTSLHHMLNAQPGVFIPDAEIFFFDVDDFEQHPDFFTDRSGRWISHDFGADGAGYLDAYASRFGLAPDGALIGEDSTTYLASRRAPERIARMLPAVRMIFVLRDPASRTYSHYWHLMRTGRATASFETMLRHQPGTMIQRSLYREQVARYLAVLPREQIHVVAFERLVSEPMGVLAEVGRFLGLTEVQEVPTDAVHRNRAQVPRVLALQRLANRIRGGRTGPLLVARSST
ncbi:MAG TPA: sulfotransferase, partial [Candidatus Limnocylindria bacterium]|nr:sulfotransferase [Candidatus Limnocylindria bacterium]